MKLMFAVLVGILGLLIYPPQKMADTVQKPNKERVQIVEAKEETSHPMSIKIPIISLNAPIVSVGLDDDGLMSVPNDNSTVSWFEPGTIPGEAGNAVLAGHNQWGNKIGVFGRLKELKNGDKITIEMSNNQEKEFTIRDITAYDTDNFPTQEIYGSKDGTKLVLITCHGRYQKKTGTYNQRLVIIAQ